MEILKYYTKKLREELSEQSSTPPACSLTIPHPMWRHTSSSARDIASAITKAKILTGTYSLEAENQG